MERENIFNELKEILKLIKPSADFSTINDDSQLVRDVGLDSLTILLLSLAHDIGGVHCLIRADEHEPFHAVLSRWQSQVHHRWRSH